LKRIKKNKRITLKNSSKFVFKFFKILSFQYIVFSLYIGSFLLPIYFLDETLFNRLNVYLILFVVIFPLIQSFFHFYYTETGSRFSRFQVWIGSILFFLIIPIFILLVP
ncbi:MAG: hypothetical protein ACRC9F_01345, partial [Metamycoplasmataceae bacterium]